MIDTVDNDKKLGPVVRTLFVGTITELHNLFSIRKKRKYLPGEIRQRSFFALFPITIASDTKWMEKVTIEEVFYQDVAAGFSGFAPIDFV